MINQSESSSSISYYSSYVLNINIYLMKSLFLIEYILSNNIYSLSFNSANYIYYFT